MATPQHGTEVIVEPNRSHGIDTAYETLYREYRRLGEFVSNRHDSTTL
jgi:hypothetical protein